MNCFLVPSQEALLRIFPNVWPALKGEASLFDKAEPAIADAETWFSANICPMCLLFQPESPLSPAEARIRERVIALGAKLVAAVALYEMLPRLDVKLDANGLATVGTPNLVAASSQRVERLLESMVISANAAIDDVLHFLPELPGWLESEPAARFASSLFIFPSQLDDIFEQSGEKERGYSLSAGPLARFEAFCRLRDRAADLEGVLGHLYFSNGLLEALRGRLIAKRQLAADVRLVGIVRRQVARRLRGLSFEEGMLRYGVQHIRENLDVFPEWEASEVAELFSDASFANSKSSSGFFF